MYQTKLGVFFNVLLSLVGFEEGNIQLERPATVVASKADEFL